MQKEQAHKDPDLNESLRSLTELTRYALRLLFLGALGFFLSDRDPLQESISKEIESLSAKVDKIDPGK